MSPTCPLAGPNYMTAFLMLNTVISSIKPNMLVTVPPQTACSIEHIHRSTMSARADHSDYQPLRSSEDDADVEQGQPSGSRPRGLRPGSIDLTKLDNAFKRLVV